MDLNIPSRVKILEKFDVADRLSFARDFTAKFLFVGRRGCLMRLDEHKYLKNCAKLCWRRYLLFSLPWALCGKINAQHAPDRICRFFMPRDPQPTDQLYRLQHLFTWDAFWRNLRLLRSTKYSQRFEHEIFFEIENFNESKKTLPALWNLPTFQDQPISINTWNYSREILSAIRYLRLSLTPNNVKGLGNCKQLMWPTLTSLAILKGWSKS